MAKGLNFVISDESLEKLREIQGKQQKKYTLKKQEKPSRQRNQLIG